MATKKYRFFNTKVSVPYPLGGLLLGLVFLTLVLVGISFELNRARALQAEEYSQSQALLSSYVASLHSTQAELASLQSAVSQSAASVAAADAAAQALPNAVAQWSPVVPAVSCTVHNADGSSQVINGSGTLIMLPGEHQYAVLTNKHVVSDGSTVAQNCSISFGGGTHTLSAPSAAIVLDPSGTDAALISLGIPDAYLAKLEAGSTRKLCPASVPAGDEVVVLGYPTIGSQQGLTATEGILSGEDGDFYITSAKVEHGNSGGAAVDVDANCFLGTPTFVTSGSLESLARVLKWQSLSSSGAGVESANGIAVFAQGMRL